ncbi:hypothetical protein Htur_3164 [Haloterrigena turkmenica DSM 5511]|uniref:Uncharacterized protein n=1 Tax=Haloterrigena turkmenica (strain ATCC 51198 / DSM 5511 / JCM 9101 / NCIMB 13204 / VKM B-1734 / 4k) TaxID=543526 RepID=D2RZJ0_HALTV|nr:hypothetical protein Htur_3164 [Haloterrigena turkmenica DSM 5511]
MQVTAIREVECPECTKRTTISVPRDGVELKPSRSRKAFGDHTKVTCANGHSYWVYFC